jgi:hypothetical protein
MEHNDNSEQDFIQNCFNAVATTIPNNIKTRANNTAAITVLRKKISTKDNIPSNICETAVTTTTTTTTTQNTNIKKNIRSNKRQRCDSNNDTVDDNDTIDDIDIWNSYKYSETDLKKLNDLLDKYQPLTRKRKHVQRSDSPCSSSVISHSDEDNETSIVIIPEQNNKRVKIDRDSNMLGWVSATKTKYYLLDDQSVDWLNYYYYKYGIVDDNSSSRNIMLRSDMETSKCRKKVSEESSQLELLFEGGNVFEKKIYQELSQIYEERFVVVLDDADMITFRQQTSISGFIKEKNEYVRKLMNQGIPIIAQAPLINDSNMTYGIADILIRSDYLAVLFNTFTPDKEIMTKAPLLVTQGASYHYRVIDCKWTTMTLCVDGVTIRNEGFFPAYKGQLAVYTAALENLQGYIPNYAYIMSKAWKIGKTNILPSEKHLYQGYSAFDRPGIIDYANKDNKYLLATKQAIQWIQRVVTEGREWRYGESKPSIPELYPNMNKSINPTYDRVKYELANRYGDPTMVWYVGSNHRKTLHKNGIYDVRDPKCTLETLGIAETGRGRIIKQIIDINKNDQTDILRPSKITNNMCDWQTKHCLDYYVDFETINCNIYHDPNIMDIDNSYFGSDVAFMIGFGFDYDSSINSKEIINKLDIDTTKCNYSVNIDTNEKWEYICLYLTSFDINNEAELYKAFYKFILERQKIITQSKQNNNHDTSHSKLFHWTSAETRFMNIAMDRIMKSSKKNDHLGENSMRNIIKDFDRNVTWVDMYKVFEQEPIVIKGAFRYKLKHIGNAFFKNNLIHTKWDNGKMSNGFKAMLEAIKLYRNNDIDNTAYSAIINYNEIDCKVIWEIVRYLRNNNC